MFYNRVIFCMFYNRGTLEPPGIPTKTLCSGFLVCFVHFLIESFLRSTIASFSIKTVISNGQLLAAVARKNVFCFIFQTFYNRVYFLGDSLVIFCSRYNNGFYHHLEGAGGNDPP